MKYISRREDFTKLIEEAKLREEIFPKQAKKVEEIWGEKYLDYETIPHTDKIKEGKWELSPADRALVIDAYFMTNTRYIKDELNKLPKEFVDAFYKSTSHELYENFDIKNPTFKQIVGFYSPYFKSINHRDTQSDSTVLKDNNNRPILDDEGKIQKVSKEKGEIIYNENQKVNINKFIESWNTAFPNKIIDENVFEDRSFTNLVNISADNPKIGDFEILAVEPMYLVITSKAKDILNMSVSKYYTSCQDLCRGSHNTQLLSNVFDPNTTPAFILFETPYFIDNEQISDFMPITRRLIRNMEKMDSTESNGLYFDRAYPDRMEDITTDIIEKYSGNTNNNIEIDNSYRLRKYKFKPDMNIFDDITDPYMDRLTLEKMPVIGKNTKYIMFGVGTDYSKFGISDDNGIEGITIDTDRLPDNFFDVKYPNLKVMKIRYVNIKSFDKFYGIIPESLILYKCILPSDFIQQLASQNIKSLSLISCKTGFTKMPDTLKDINVEELELVFTYSKLSSVLLEMTNLKKLTLSSNIKDGNKDLIDKLKKKGVKIDYKGL